MVRLRLACIQMITIARFACASCACTKCITLLSQGWSMQLAACSPLALKHSLASTCHNNRGQKFCCLSGIVSGSIQAEPNLTGLQASLHNQGLALCLLWAGKYDNEYMPAGPRTGLFRQILPGAQPLLETLSQVADTRGKTVPQVNAPSHQTHAAQCMMSTVEQKLCAMSLLGTSPFAGKACTYR